MKYPDGDLISVGVIVGTHGIRGQVKVKSLSDHENRFNQLDRVYIDGETLEALITAHVDSAFVHKNLYVVSFKEWDDINSVEGFRGCTIKIPRQERPELPENSFYFDEVKGLKVLNEKREPLGIVTGIYQTGANDVYQVKSEVYGEYLIPATRQVITHVDLETGEMIVHLPEGLLEEA